MSRRTTFELWLWDERGVLSKPRDPVGRNDHTGFAKPGSIRGWARIEARAIVLLRTDRAEAIPRTIWHYYATRFPKHKLEDRAAVHMRGGGD